MKLPKNFSKLSAKDQEEYLVKKLEQLHSEENNVRMMLGKVRGGTRIVIAEKEERPDELIMKSA